MKILVIYDGSQDSKAALKYGVHKARAASGGELIAVHVFPRTGFNAKNKNPGERKPVPELLSCLKKIETFVSRRGNIVTISMAAATVNHRDEILTFAEKLAVDLIVAPPAYEALMEKACCISDIVSAQTAISELFA